MNHHHLEFEQLPSLMGAYALALRPKRASQLKAPWPHLSASVAQVAISAHNLNAFCALFTLPQRKTLPMIYPHLLAAPLHAQLLTHPSMPVKAAGIVHVRNSITLHRPLTRHETYHLHVAHSERREAKRGHEFDLLTTLSVDDQPVWSEITTVLSPVKLNVKRQKSDRITPPHTAQAHHSPPHTSSTWRLSADLGQRYAKVCHDFNPIHLTPLSAKLFGFKRPIIHGMWTASRALSDLQDHLPSSPWRYDVEFKRPIYLPSRVIHTAWQTDSGAHIIEVRSPDQQTLHMYGVVTATL